MNFRTTVILFVLVIAGLIFFIVANRNPEPQRTQDAPTGGPGDPQQGRKLLDLKVEDVKRVVVKPLTGQFLELEKGEGPDWKIVQPVAWAADDFGARGFVESIVNVRSRGRVEAGTGSRADFGLEKPRYVIEVTDKNNKTTTLQVGNQTALGNDLYVDAGDGKGTSLAAGGELTGKLEKGTQKIFEELRDKKLVDAQPTDVRQVEITRRGQPKLVLRREGADWKVVEPKQVAADSGEVSSMLSVVTGLRAEEFVTPNSPEASGAMIDQPRLAVWFSTDAPSTQPTQPTTGATTAPATAPATRSSGTTVAFGQYADVEEEKVYVKVSPQPDVLAKASVSEWQWDRLAQASPVTLRDRKVLDVDPERVERVAISIDKGATTQPTTKPAEKREVVLQRRRETPATQQAADAATRADVVAGAEAQGDAVLASAALQPADTKAGPDASAKAGADASAKTNPDPSAKTAPDASAAKSAAPAITEPPTTTPSPTTTTAPSTSPSTGPATAPAAPPTKWVIASDPKGDADDAKVDSLLQGLHPLRASKYLESAPTTPVTATYTVRATTNPYGDQPAQSYELKLTETGTGSDAKVVGYYQDLVFEVDRFFLDRLTADFKKGSEPEPADGPGVLGLPGFPGRNDE